MSGKQRKLAIRIGISACLAIAVYLTVRFVPIDKWWLCVLLYLVPYVVVGYDVIRGAALNIIHGRLFDEKFLMMIATVGAFVIGEYSEAVMVMLFYQLGELLQSIAVGKSRKSISALMDIRPDSAVVLVNGEEVTVSPEEVKKGDIIIIRPGEKVPLDGIIVNGSTSVNTASLTGESLPSDKFVGDYVYSGSINLSGVIEAETTGVYAESTVSKILNLVENSQEKKAKSENFITKFAKYYTPAVVICAVMLGLIPSIVTGNWQEWLRRAIVFLVVSCPCALVISVPLSFFGGIGGASRKGILIKGSNFLEVLAKADTVVFDKTGTLTEGKFSVSEIVPNGISREELLRIAALAESYSTHPIAKSIVAESGLKEEDKEIVRDVKEHAGYGMEVLIGEDRIYAGNKAFMEFEDIKITSNCLGSTPVYIARGKEYLGYISVSDTIKKDAQKAISDLNAEGVGRTVMLTGDLLSNAENVAEKLGIKEVYAGLLPEQKVEKAEEIKRLGKVMVFVGDGINDAPVLTVSDVGMAMGAMGSDAAIEAADIVIMDDKPSKIATAIKTAKKTMRIVWQNIIFALVVKIAVLALGAFGVVGMWAAVFADVGVTIIAILNALRAGGRWRPHI